jgi:ectoine hydroxylase-related dioxygenase (phytanoyl-CoA dioxygenase family)
MPQTSELTHTSEPTKYIFSPESLPAIQRALDEDGFVVLRNAFTEDELSDVTGTITYMLSAHAQLGETVSDTCVRLDKENPRLLYRIYQYSGSTLGVNRVRQACLKFARVLLPGKGIYIDIDSSVIFNLPRDTRLTWTWHQESAYHPQIPESLGFWYPLIRPATVGNGTMSFLKGTHKLGLLPWTKHKPRADGATSLVPADIDRLTQEFPEVHCVTDVGDLVIFHKHMVHRSNFNASDTPRFTGLVRLALIDRIPDRYGKAT